MTSGTPRPAARHDRTARGGAVPHLAEFVAGMALRVGLSVALLGLGLSVPVEAFAATDRAHVRCSCTVRLEAKGFSRSLGRWSPGRAVIVLGKEGRWSLCRVEDQDEGATVTGGWVRTGCLAPIAATEAALIATKALATPTEDGAGPAETERLSEFLPLPGTAPGPVAVDPSRDVADPRASGVLRRAPLLVAAIAWDEVLVSQHLPTRLLVLRSEPSFSLPFVASVPAGQSVEELEIRGAWMRVRTQAGASGWIVTAALTAPPLLPRSAARTSQEVLASKRSTRP